MHFDYAQCKQKGSALSERSESKGFAQPLLIVAVIIILLAGGFYLYQGSKDNKSLQSLKFAAPKQSQFNSYTNAALGLEFQYAKELQVKEDSEAEVNKRGNGDFRKNFKGYVGYEPGKFLGAVVVLDKDQKFDTNPFTLWVFDNPRNLTIDEWYKNYWYYPFVWGDFTYTGKFVLAPKTEATVSGQIGKTGVIDYQPGKPKFVYLAKNKKMYLFRIIGDTGDKILSTFKFLP